MRKKVMFVLFAMALLPVFAMAETWNNVTLMDGNCAAKAKADPDAHTRDCMLKCQKAGLGVVTANGDYLKLDASGNDQALALLKNADKKDHLRVNVVGERVGDTIKVQSIKM